MISVPFELDKVEFGILIPGSPLPEKSQKECGLRKNIWNTVSPLPPTQGKETGVSASLVIILSNTNVYLEIL